MSEAGRDLLVVDALHGLQRAAPVAPLSMPSAADPDSVLERLTKWAKEFARGQVEATLKAVRSDWGRHIAWCDGTQHFPLPATPDLLEAFLQNAVARGRKCATLKRYVYTVGLIHEAAGLGAGNDLINSGATTAQIQHAGNWKSAEMVHSHTRQSQAGSNSAAELRQSKRGGIGDGA